MGLLKEQDKREITKIFQGLENQVKLVMFTQKFECQSCEMARKLMEELSELSPKIVLEVHDFQAESDLAKKYGVDKIPALALLGEKDYGIRFYGVPGGYEFTVLLEEIVLVSRRSHDLSQEVVAELAKVDKPVHMQAMISPTCPYCPAAVRTAHRFAMASEHIRGDMVEISQFPHLAVKYNVRGVPNTIINEKESVAGAQPEMEFAKAVLRSIGK